MVVGAPAIPAGLGVTALGIGHVELLVRAFVQELLQAGQAGIGLLRRGRASAAPLIPVRAAGRAAPAAVLAAEPLQGDAQEELLPDHLPQVEALALVVSHDHVAVGELDLLLLPPLLPRPPGP